MNCPTCNTHIDEHPASRCLDAWVAEAVMGLRIMYGAHAGEMCLWPEEFGEGEFPRDFPPKPVPDYSIDIAAAWEVLEKLICHQPQIFVNDDGLWEVVFMMDLDVLSQSVGETPELAICRAVLSW